jgi:hypothetical protein
MAHLIVPCRFRQALPKSARLLNRFGGNEAGDGGFAGYATTAFWRASVNAAAMTSKFDQRFRIFLFIGPSQICS